MKKPRASSWTRGFTTTTPASRVSMISTFSPGATTRSEEHTSELQSRQYLVCRLLLEKKQEQTPVGAADSGQSGNPADLYQPRAAGRDGFASGYGATKSVVTAAGNLEHVFFF